LVSPKKQVRKKSGNKHAANIHRSDRKKARYNESLRRRAHNVDKKAVRLLDSPRTKSGKRTLHCENFPHCIHTGR